MTFDEDKIVAAANLFEQTKGRRLEKSELDDLERANLPHRDAEQLAMQLVDFIRKGTGLTPEIRGSGYWALGKRGDVALLPFFRDTLAAEMKMDMRVAYQIMIALDNLGEVVFSQARSGVSYDEDDLNKRDALDYLKRASGK